MSEILIFILFGCLPALGIGLGHWFPWRKVIGHDLSRLQAYAYGVLWIVAMPVVVMLAQGATGYALLLLLSVASAGGATLLAYAIDTWIETKHKLLDEKDRAIYASHRHADEAPLAD